MQQPRCLNCRGGINETSDTATCAICGYACREWCEQCRQYHLAGFTVCPVSKEPRAARSSEAPLTPNYRAIAYVVFTEEVWPAVKHPLFVEHWFYAGLVAAILLAIVVIGCLDSGLIGLLLAIVLWIYWERGSFFFRDSFQPNELNKFYHHIRSQTGQNLDTAKVHALGREYAAKRAARLRLRASHRIGIIFGLIVFGGWAGIGYSLSVSSGPIMQQPESKFFIGFIALASALTTKVAASYIVYKRLSARR